MVGSATPGGDGRDTDWGEIGRSQGFNALVASRRRFVLPALVVFTVWFGGFLVLTAYARDFMAKRVVGAIPWAYVLALSLIVMTWLIAWLYLRWSDARLAPLVDRVADDSRSDRP